MASVTFKRTNNIDSVPITDGQLIFDTSDQKIYLDNGNTREVYGGGSGTDLISNVSDATDNNAFNANATVNLFTRKSSIVDTKAEIQSVTQAGVPLGCKGFNEVVGTGDISALGDGSVTGAILANKSAIDTVNQNLTIRNTRVNLSTNYLQYMDSNGDWQDIMRISGGTYVSIMPKPFSAVGKTSNGTITATRSNEYVVFNDSHGSVPVYTGDTVTYMFDELTQVDQLRGWGQVTYPDCTAIFEYTLDGTNWSAYGTIASTTKDVTFTQTMLIRGIRVRVTGVSGYAFYVCKVGAWVRQ